MNKTLLLLICATVSSAAFAVETPSGDRQARREQMQAKAQARFAEADRNRDGKLSLAEWQDARDQKMAEQFARLDVDKDGSLSQDELRQGHQQRRHTRQARRHGAMAMREEFKALDANHDRALTRAEIGDRLPRLAANFDRIDGNRDGKLTGEEMRAARDTLRAQPR